MIANRLLHGGDYNPEQWLECPEVLKEDIAYMKQAGVNCVTLGIFSWSMLEPEEGVYDFQWLEDCISRLYDNGILVILATPSGAMPHWMTAKYPQVMQVQADGKRNLPGRRHNFCYTSPVYRKKVKEMNLALSERFGKHEAVILWHISNELGGNGGDGACHCELCQEAFRGWLKNKYKTLDNINHAWWNRFWSHVYTDWDQIHSPVPHGENVVHGLNLDWKRFVTAQMADFCEKEAEALRTCSPLPVTTNFMDFFKSLDYHQLHKCLDVVSWDNYPDWHADYDEVPVAVRAAAGHSMMRSMKKRPFLLMESTPSCVNWRCANALKRPGMHMLSSMQAVAHGSDSVQYFQWRKGRGGFEKFHGAVLDHKNGSGTRTFQEVSDTGKRLSHLTGYMRDRINRPEAAIVYDWENWWALEDVAGPRHDFDYTAEALRHYQAFWEHGIEADFVSMEADLSGYALVCAPLNYLYREGYADRIRDYVKNGGCYVTTCFSGMADSTDLCFTGRHPLEDVLGVIQEEVDVPGKGFENSFTYRGRRYNTGRLREICHPLDTAKVLAVYEQDFYAGRPVVVEHSYGTGKSIYLAAETESDFLREFYQEVFRERGLVNPLGIRLPYGVTTAVRKGDPDVVFVMNFSHKPVSLQSTGNWKDVDNGACYSGRLELDGLSCKILTRA